jgi:bifunctional DNase/RNase
MKLVEVVAVQLEATTGAPVVVLREHDEAHRLLPLFVGGLEATAIALALTGTEAPRPLTHDLMATVVDRLHARLDRIEVTGVSDGAYLAELVLVGPNGAVRVDARPSDAIALAVRAKAPMFVADDVLERAAALVQVVGVDQGDVDDEVEGFRRFLDQVDPADFADPGAGGGGAAGQEPSGGR